MGSALPTGWAPSSYLQGGSVDLSAEYVLEMKNITKRYGAVSYTHLTLPTNSLV